MRLPSLGLLLASCFTTCLVVAAGCGGGSPARDAGDAGSPDGGGDSATCPTGGSGQLALAINGLPAGVTPMVRVTGGGLAAPMDLTAGTPATLNAGAGYEIQWRRVKTAPAAGSVVGKAFYVSAKSFDGCVKKDATTTATLTYTQEPGSEKLWMTVSNAPTLGHVLGAFNGADIAATGMHNPAVWKSKNITGRGGAGAFDTAGNFWLPAGDRINKYAMLTLGTSDETPPAVTLTQPDSAAAKFAAFDADGNLWVSRGAPLSDDSVVRYAVADLAASGSPTPAVVLKSPDLTNPAGLAFDKAGALWVTNDALGTDAKPTGHQFVHHARAAGLRQGRQPVGRLRRRHREVHRRPARRLGGDQRAVRPEAGRDRAAHQPAVRRVGRSVDRRRAGDVPACPRRQPGHRRRRHARHRHHQRRDRIRRADGI